MSWLQNKSQNEAAKHYFHDEYFSFAASYWLLFCSHAIIVRLLFCYIEPLFVKLT